MRTRTKYFLLGGIGVAMLAGIVAEQNRPPADPLATARAAIALAAAKTIRQSAKDPDSVTFVSLDVNTDGTVACAEYRGRNSFNALVKQFTVFVNGAGITGNTTTWNKHCTKAMYSHMPLVR